MIVLDPVSLQHSMLTASATKRLLTACALGGVIGLEREWRHKDSGLRTNMLICVGAALFTFMSAALAGDLTPDKSRVASNIVQGVGFLGAGLILHTKSRVVGLTSAATVFVVAAIGMTCGAGLYLGALVATVVVLLSLQTVGFLRISLGGNAFPCFTKSVHRLANCRERLRSRPCILRASSERQRCGECSPRF